MSLRIAAKTAIRPAVEAPNRCWHVVADADHTLAEALAPGYMAIRVKDMRPGDTFDIRHEKHAFLVRGYILAVDKEAGAISYAALEVIDLHAIPAIVYDWADAEVKRLPSGFAVMRGQDALKTGFPTEAAANEFLHAKRTLAAAGKVTA